jgi:hypothetical protein
MTTLQKLVKKIILGTLIISAVAVVGVTLFGTVNTLAQATTGIPNLGRAVCSSGPNLDSRANCAFINPEDATRGGIANFILKIARFITFIAGAIAVVVIVISGVQRMNISDAKAYESSNKNLINAAIGLGIAILAYTIVGVLSVFLVGNFFGV